MKERREENYLSYVSLMKVLKFCELLAIQKEQDDVKNFTRIISHNKVTYLVLFSQGAHRLLSGKTSQELLL